ncbi:Probable ubiquinone biosynthesis protein UbiB [Raoultella terrigena]|nr:Probable ubiquinone biosynthesis protein UbiB [Raoultella terrigena]
MENGEALSFESWIKDQVGIPALVRAFKEKAPFWIERMPEIPELVYQSLQQSKQLQHSVDTIVHDIQVRHARQGESRYLFGIGAVLFTQRYAVIYPPAGVGA